MSLQSDWKMGKFLEWYTELPVENRPRQSPTFLIQNIESYFLFTRNYYYPSYEYSLYLMPKITGRKLEKFSFVFYSDFDVSGNFKTYQGTFSNSETRIHYFKINEQGFSNRGLLTSSIFFIKFCFMFKSENGPLLPLEPRIGK